MESYLDFAFQNQFEDFEIDLYTIYSKQGQDSYSSVYYVYLSYYPILIKY